MSASYTVHRGVRVETRDGVGLATDVHLPDGDGPFPTLLQRTPYDRTDPFGAQFIVQLTILRALDAGFAVVVQDTRGRYASEGDFDPFVHETDDGVDTLRWIRAQEFSNGYVATYGASYVGATQTLLALAGEDGQDAMAPFLTTADLGDGWTYRGGALQLGFVLLWVIEALGPVDVLRRGLPTDDPARALLASMADDPHAAMRSLPVVTDALRRLAPYLADWASHPATDPWWEPLSAVRAVERVTTPALHVAGFNDVFLEGSLAAYQALRREGRTPEVRDGQHLVIGPWSHGNLGDWQGQQWHGYAASAPAIDLVGMQLDFFSAVVSGETPDLPRVRYFTSGSNTWATAEDWPPPARETRLFLSPRGELAEQPDAETTTATWTADPGDPVPTAGGATFLPGLLVNRNDGPQDQAEVEARDDVVVYRGPVLEHDVQVTGLVTLELVASSSALDCDWTGRLVDVDEAGRAVGIVDGVLRSRFRAGPDPRPLVPGEPERFVVELGHTSHVFRAGHRIGLQVASSNFPRFDRNPQSLADPATVGPADLVVAEQTVLQGGPTPSCLVLPVLA